jgi:alkanesulfonate monooxygenase
MWSILFIVFISVQVSSSWKQHLFSFIFSGYPHHQEAQYFAKWVLPHLKTISLPKLYGRIPQDPPNTPLGKGPRF